eukprot:PhM_4_TR453/c0_g1_i1/m.31181
MTTIQSAVVVESQQQHREGTAAATTSFSNEQYHLAAAAATSSSSSILSFAAGNLVVTDPTTRGRVHSFPIRAIHNNNNNESENAEDANHHHVQTYVETTFPLLEAMLTNSTSAAVLCTPSSSFSSSFYSSPFSTLVECLINDLFLSLGLSAEDDISSVRLTMLDVASDEVRCLLSPHRDKVVCVKDHPAQMALQFIGADRIDVDTAEDALRVFRNGLRARALLNNDSTSASSCFIKIEVDTTTTTTAAPDDVTTTTTNTSCSFTLFDIGTCHTQSLMSLLKTLGNISAVIGGTGWNTGGGTGNVNANNNNNNNN